MEKRKELSVWSVGESQEPETGRRRRHEEGDDEARREVKAAAAGAMLCNRDVQRIRAAKR
jgi:hypothetical protein